MLCEEQRQSLGRSEKCEGAVDLRKQVWPEQPHITRQETGCWVRGARGVLVCVFGAPHLSSPPMRGSSRCA